MMLLLEGVVSIYGTVCSVLACEGVFWSMMGSRKDAAVITFESLQVPCGLALLKTSVGRQRHGGLSSSGSILLHTPQERGSFQ